MMVNLADIIVFDPNTATVYGMAELAVSMNGNAIQITLPRRDGGDPFTPMTVQQPKPKRRSRTAKSNDKKMSRALAQANQELRKVNGELRKGVTQGDIMTRAHRIRKTL